MSKSLDKSAFFVINISERNVCLSDLALTIPAGRCYDLLNDNFYYTIDQLKASLKSGSLYKKRDKIKIGKRRPQEVGLDKIELSKYPIITRNRSAIKIEEPAFDELIFSDDDYANEMANRFEE